MDEDPRKLWLRAFVFSTCPVAMSAFKMAAHADDDDRYFNGRFEDYNPGVGYDYDDGSKMDDDVGAPGLFADWTATVTYYATHGPEVVSIVGQRSSKGGAALLQLRIAGC